MGDWWILIAFVAGYVGCAISHAIDVKRYSRGKKYHYCPFFCIKDREKGFKNKH